MAEKTAFDELREVTRVNLPKEFKDLYDLSEEVTHFANRCYLDATLNRFNQAIRAASRLNKRAQERYEDGMITGDEYTLILGLTGEILYEDLPARIRSGLVKECSCKIRD